MKSFIKKFLVLCAIFTATTVTTNLTSTSSAYAAECREPFLGMTAWDCNADTDNIDSEDDLVNSAIIIAGNVLTDLIVLASYLVIGFVIYGGYLYIFASGDVGKVAAGKKTLTRAFIGLAIVSSAYIIMNTIRIVFMGNTGKFSNDCLSSGANCVNASDFVVGTINWFIASAGVVALIFVLIGGIGYMTSAGDPAKLQKSKNTITYALIGLAIVALSLTITAFVSNLIKG